MDNIAAIGAMILSLSIAIASGVRYLLERRRRTRSQDIDGIDKLLTRLEKVSLHVEELQEQRARDYRERQKLRNDLWAANGRIYQLEQKQKEYEQERNGWKRLLTVAIEYIDVLSGQIVDAGGKPTAKPDELVKWLKDNNGHGQGHE